MLRWLENRPKCCRIYYLQYFVASGPPNKGPKIGPTSVENRSQELSLLRPVSSTHQNRIPSPSGAILRLFLNIKYNFWVPTSCPTRRPWGGNLVPGCLNIKPKDPYSYRAAFGPILVRFWTNFWTLLGGREATKYCK